jgi:GDPmannose 4,6-dehydratase
MKRALITGVTGQDGAYLSKLLLEKGYAVYGSTREAPAANLERLRLLGTDREVRLVSCDLSDTDAIRTVIESVQPDELYNCAAQSFPSASFAEPLLVTDIDGAAVARLLEVLRGSAPDTRFFQASSAEMFGAAAVAPQDETTPFRPPSPYAAAKALAHWMAVIYRETHLLYASCGILFNHESPLRGRQFVTRKIAEGVARLKYGLLDRLTLGNLNARRDWGYAPEYVEAMWLMLQQDRAEDFVIATGESHTVREFVETAFHVAGIEVGWQGEGLAERGIDVGSGRLVVEVSREFFRQSAAMPLVGNAEKARKRLGWRPRTHFRDLVAIMVAEELRAARRLAG